MGTINYQIRFILYSVWLFSRDWPNLIRNMFADVMEQDFYISWLLFAVEEVCPGHRWNKIYEEVTSLLSPKYLPDSHLMRANLMICSIYLSSVLHVVSHSSFPLLLFYNKSLQVLLLTSVAHNALAVPASQFVFHCLQTPSTHLYITAIFNINAFLVKVK